MWLPRDQDNTFYGKNISFCSGICILYEEKKKKGFHLSKNASNASIKMMDTCRRRFG